MYTPGQKLPSMGSGVYQLAPPRGKVTAQTKREMCYTLFALNASVVSRGSSG